MKRVVLGRLLFVALSFLLVPPVAGAQAPKSAPQYRPLSNGEMAQQGLWDAWITEFNALTGKQKAEVVRRHIQMCLDSFELTKEQRTLVTEMTAKFVTEAAYSETDAAKRAAMQQVMQPYQEKALALLGHELTGIIFFAKPPISVVIEVKNDPKFK
ncbi:MAG: hypothetical protein NTV05_06985 [Acidobacteria bacterium]|nr:hypothetical protein [Acidobacteriota bacterium]